MAMQRDYEKCRILNYQYTQEQTEQVEFFLSQLFRKNRKLFVVIDDDPTGGQTVHDVNVYTNWNYHVMLEAFKTETVMFYIMTNSRSMTRAETIKVHEEIMDSLNRASKLTNRKYEVISRGDSTLRGHYPTEPDIIRKGLGKTVQKEIIIPFFQEGNRYTLKDIHCLIEDGMLIPVGESEFAKDKTFGFKNSNLKRWIEEKTSGAYPAALVESISLEMLRNLDFEGIEQILTDKKSKKVIVNVTCYMDLKVFAVCYFLALQKGFSFVARTAASWPKVIGGFPEVPYIQGKDIVDGNSSTGGLIIIGSHVSKTTEQFEILKNSGLDINFIEFNQHEATDIRRLEMEVQRVSQLTNQSLAGGLTTVVYTRRKRLDFNTESKEEELIVTNRIADAITTIAAGIEKKPRYLIVKGGITSSDVAVKAFCATKATIWGQVAPGIPVWKLGEGSKYPGMIYVIFPGNVGTKNTLYEIVGSLQ